MPSQVWMRTCALHVSTALQLHPSSAPATHRLISSFLYWRLGAAALQSCSRNVFTSWFGALKACLSTCLLLREEYFFSQTPVVPPVHPVCLSVYLTQRWSWGGQQLRYLKPTRTYTINKYTHTYKHNLIINFTKPSKQSKPSLQSIHTSLLNHLYNQNTSN